MPYALADYWQQTTGAPAFHGPLFLIGMPRSGTKLLRAMLNEHPRVRIPDIETEFLPYWIANWESYGPLDTLRDFQSFCRKCQALPYFRQTLERGIDVDCNTWFCACREFTPAEVFESLLRSVLSIPQGDDKIIWGDKSPSYIGHIELLKSQFPAARFIHIVRDARDYCLSMQKAWGKNVLRAAQRWEDDVSKARCDGAGFPGSYLELRYEDLILDPEAVLREVCRFLEIDFDGQILQLRVAPENRGDAIGRKDIISTNAGKHQSEMNSALITQIEQITCNSLRALGYNCHYAGEPVRLPNWKLRILQAMDGFDMVKAVAAKRGVIHALKSQLRYFHTSGNQQR